MCQRSRASNQTPLTAPQRHPASENGYRLGRSWLPGRVGRCLHATRVLAATLVCTAAPCAAQDTQPSDNPLGELLKTAAPVRTPTPDEAMRAFDHIQMAVEAWTVPEPFASPAQAVRVALHQQGLLAGAGTATTENAGAPGALAAAAQIAMERAARTLVPRAGAVAPEQLRLLAPDLTISLELAGPFTPLTATELTNPDAIVRPGLDGLAVRVEGEWLVSFPSEIRAAGTPAGIRLPAMAARLLGDPALGIELPIDLATQHGAAFYRFEVIHVAKIGRGTPAFLTRGGRVVQTSNITTGSIAKFADEMLSHLEAARAEAQRVFPDERLGIAGTLDAARGVASIPATPTQQSLVALALTKVSQTSQVDPEARERARALAHTIMADLAVVEAIEIDPADDGVAAAIAWVVLDDLNAGESEELAELYTRCGEMLAAHAAAERDDVAPSVSNAILVWALAERAARIGQDADTAERDLRRLYRATPPGGLVGLMPWLGWAELRLATTDEPVPAQAALRRVREQVWDHQLFAADTGPAEADLAGGVVFTRGLASLPTWATARPAALCATMLADPRLTPADETPAEIVRLIGVMRFLRQLSAREAECAFYPRPGLARGGVRAALWEHSMPPEATAMTLLAATEFLGALETLQNRQKPAESPDSR